MKPTLLLSVIIIAMCSFSRPSHSSPKQQGTIFSDSLELKKLIIRKDAIKLSPNPSYDGKVSVVSNVAETLHFYIFDLEGTLIYQAVLSNKEGKTIDKLNKGTYMYDVFENDESIEEGKILVK